MPTNRRKRTRGRADLDAQHIDQLVTGLPLLAGTGFSAGIGDGGCNCWSPQDWKAFQGAMMEGWIQHGAAFMRWWRREAETFTHLFQDDPRKADLTPWALRQFGDPE